METALPRRPGRPQNVREGERLASLLAGAALTWFGVRRRTPIGLGLAALGAGLVARGASGRCAVYKALGIDTVSKREKPLEGGGGKGRDVVQEASEESFPASDPPSWTPQRT